MKLHVVYDLWRHKLRNLLFKSKKLSSNIYMRDKKIGFKDAKKKGYNYVFI